MHLEQRFPAAGNQLQHQRGGAHLQRGGKLAHVRIADNDVEAPILPRVGMRLIAGVHDRAAVKRVHARLFGEEIRPLGELEGALVLEGPSQLHPGLARPREDLAGHKERHQPELQLLERHLPGNQVALVAAIAHAMEVRVVLEDRDRPARRR